MSGESLAVMNNRLSVFLAWKIAAVAHAQGRRGKPVLILDQKPMFPEIEKKNPEANNHLFIIY